MHPAPIRLARFDAQRHQVAVATALRRINASADTALAYLALCLFWGFLLYLTLNAIGG